MVVFAFLAACTPCKYNPGIHCVQCNNQAISKSDMVHVNYTSSYNISFVHLLEYLMMDVIIGHILEYLDESFFVQF